MDVSAYLRRIAYVGPVAPTAATLRALHVAHLRTVPFENLSIHLGEPIVLNDEALFEKIVLRRRGGFCYELNGLFAGLLRALGFEVSMLSAGVMSASGQFGPEFDHMTLLVRLAELWLADVGFGDSFVEPLRLRAGEWQMQERDRWRLSVDGPSWLLSRATGDDEPIPKYRFTLTPHVYEDYAAMCSFHQASPESPFTRQRMCTIATPEGRLTIAGRRLLITRGSAKEERAVGSETEHTTLLRDLFGVELPRIHAS
jgi:N-hydroxyarylamine O-acetyltransferase